MSTEIKDSMKKREHFTLNKDGKVRKYYHYNPEFGAYFSQKGEVYGEDPIVHFACFGGTMTADELASLKRMGFEEVKESNSYLHNSKEKLSIFKTSIPGHFEVLRSIYAESLSLAKPLALLPFEEIINYIEEEKYKEEI